MRILLKNGRVIDPHSGTDSTADLLIEDGVIAAIAEGLTAPGAERLDADGLIVAPGFIDMHTHLREPGFEHKETIESGGRSAVKGGFCAVVAMANTDPVADTPEVVRFVREQAEKAGWARVYPVGAVTVGQRGERLTEINMLKEAGAVALSDDGHSVVDSKVFSIALECAKMCDLTVISHCEDPYLAEGGCMNEGEVSSRLGAPGIPAEAEEIIVARDIVLARMTGARLHIAHVSCARAVALIRAAKHEGINVTAETAPHYFTLTEEAVTKHGANAKMNPPLRTMNDVEAVKEGIRDGTIDAIATDHAPHTESEKEASLTEAPFGVIGLETCLPLVITELVDKGILSLAEAISKLTVAPARILNLPMGGIAVGARADVTVFDPLREFTVDADEFESKSRNTPFHGCRVKGRAVHVIVNGELRLRNGNLIR